MQRGRELWWSRGPTTNICCNNVAASSGHSNEVDDLMISQPKGMMAKSINKNETHVVKKISKSALLEGTTRTKLSVH